jgi:hypothetical protein
MVVKLDGNQKYQQPAMKTNLFGKCILGTTLAVLCLAGGRSLTTAVAQEQPAPASGDAALPADIAPDSPLAQVVRLAQSGVDESVILAYINNSSSAFNLTPDQIIYLKDLGLPNDAVTAMIQRDQQLGATAAAAPAPQTTAQTETPEQPAVVTQNYFYDTLSPYGGWVNVDGYGLCWQPTVVVYNSDWQPYCDHGHWVYTDDGWYWLSDYSWGATTFHYGRWFRDSHRGWCWWPDTAWAPSWVTWRYADDYCGWAPLPPRTVYREGVGIFYNGVAVGANFDFGLSVNFFTFVPTRNFCDPHPRHFRAGPSQVAQIYSHTAIINNFNMDSHSHTIINGGIPREHISAITRTEIRPVSIHETSGPGSHGEQLGRGGQTITVNRPHFDPAAATVLNNGVRPRPVTVTRQNPPGSLIINGNRNSSNPRFGAPAQNNFSQPDRSLNIRQTPAANQIQTPRGQQQHSAVSTPVQKTTPNYYSPSAQTPNSNYDPDKRVYAPKQQQIISQEPIHYSPPAAPAAPAAPVERPQNVEPRRNYSQPAPQPAAPVERQQHNGSRQNSPPPAAPSAPANNSSSGSQQSGRQDWNQNNRQGH